MLNSLAIPIVQGPMLGVSTPAMVTAVSLAGGLGSLAASNLAPAAIEASVSRIGEATGGAPFAINLFVQEPAHPSSETVAAAIERLRPWREELGLPAQSVPNQWAEDFSSQFDALLRAAPPVASFTFGCLAVGQVAALKGRGVYVVGTATTVAEARAWEAVGADAVCAQGFESGGHRGTFLAPVVDSLVGVVALVPAVCAAIRIPVIAAGGIMDGRGVAAALMLGAAAAQMGTAFLLAPEAATSQPYRDAVRAAGDDPTRLTRAVSGRHARGIENRFMREMRAIEDDVPAYPVQNALTGELRAAAASLGSPDQLSLWAGQGVHLVREGGVAEIVEAVWREAAEARRTLDQRFGAGGDAACRERSASAKPPGYMTRG